MTAPRLSLLPQRAKCENNAQGRALGPPEIGAVPLAKSAHGQMGAGFCFSGAVLPGEQVDLQFSSAHSQHEAEIPAKKCRILKCPPPPHIQGMQEIREPQPQLILPWNICGHLWVGSIRHWGSLSTGFVSQGNESGVGFYGTFGLRSRSVFAQLSSSQDNEELPSHLHCQFLMKMG